MKKVALIVLVAVGSVALAASLNVPWFADNAPVAASVPPSSGTTALVALHNNLSTEITCQINYFAADGTALTGADTTERDYVWTAVYNTFAIDANATIQFRPVADDPSVGVAGGQESESGVVVPNRPRYGEAGSATLKANGALVVSWGIDGDNGANASSVQGRVASYASAGSAGMYLLPGGS